MPDITTWDGMLVASGRDELIGNFDHYTKPDLSYANREIRASVRPIYPWCPEPVEPTPFEVNKEVVSIQDHNRFNPGPFQEGSAIFPGHGVIAEDHSAGSFRDSLTGEGRPTKIWTNGGASTFEDRHVGDYDANDAVFSMRQNIDWTAANGGPGSSYLTAKDTSQSNAYVDEDVDGFMKLGDIRGELQTTDLRSDNRFVIERFEPLAEMNSFGESLNPVFQLGTNSGPGATTFLTGQFDMPTNNIGGSADHGGDDI